MAGFAAIAVLLAGPAHAFSLIDPGDGSEPVRHRGIVAIPLPPLPPKNGTGKPAETPAEKPARQTVPGEMEGTDAGEVPISRQDEERRKRRDGAASAVDDTGKGPRPFREEHEAPDRGFTDTGESDAGANDAGDDRSPTPRVVYGTDDLPGPVRALRAALIEAARSGRIERLRPFVASGRDGTLLSLQETPDDPIAYLKEKSGDGDGLETLAVLLGILDSGHVRTRSANGETLYVWPYFAEMDMERLTPSQLVELFEIVSAGDYQAMQDEGVYDFYSLGISADGELKFFLAR